MNILFLDTETTGLSPQKHRILEIGASLYLDWYHNTPITTYSIKLGYWSGDIGEVSLGAIAVNKIPINELTPTGDRKNWKDAIRDFVDWLVQMKTAYGDFVVCGQNPKFDYDFLEATCQRTGVEGIESLLGRYPIDVGVIGRTMQLLGLLSPANKCKSEDMAKELNVKLGTHTVMGDIETTEELLYACLKKLGVIATK